MLYPKMKQLLLLFSDDWTALVSGIMKTVKLAKTEFSYALQPELYSNVGNLKIYSK